MSTGSIYDWKKRILPLREQAEIVDSWLEYRLAHVLPRLMEQEKIHMWVVIARENNEDPTISTFLPATMLSAPRRTILAFHLKSPDVVECLSFCKVSPEMDKFYTQAWDSEKEEQWQALAREIKERDPEDIGLNFSDYFALGDGLTKSQYDQFMAALDPEHTAKVKSAERLAIAWLEKRTPRELVSYAGINRIAHDIIAKAFSPEVIHPGITTPNDVAWWMRQTISDMGLQAWFHPTVGIQRSGRKNITKDETILPGDLLHCDMGLHYLGLATDTQQMAYVLQPGENEPPQDILEAMALANRLQDILAARFVVGRTGNEILQEVLEQARDEGIKAMIYTHPIGFHGHGAGPTIGLFDKQTFLPVSGEYPLHNDTCYAVELNIKKKIAGWNDQEIMIALEQTAAFTGGKVEYLGGRQKEMHCI